MKKNSKLDDLHFFIDIFILFMLPVLNVEIIIKVAAYLSLSGFWFILILNLLITIPLSIVFILIILKGRFNKDSRDFFSILILYYVVVIIGSFNQVELYIPFLTAYVIHAADNIYKLRGKKK